MKRTSVGLGVVILAALTLATVLPSLNPSAVSAAKPGSGLSSCAPGVQFLGFSDALNKLSFEGVPNGDEGLSGDKQTRA